MAGGFAGDPNTFVPSFEASGKLQIEYSRNPKSFPINKYVKNIPVKEDKGYYLNLDTSACARIQNTTGREWPDGQEAPNGDWFKVGLDWPVYITKRYATPYSVGQKATDQAAWDVLATYGRVAAQAQMTFRTKKAITALTTTGNWGNNTGTATAVGGGVLDTATTSNNYNQALMQAVASRIHKATYGMTDWPDLNMVMNPNTASRIARSPEVVDWLKQSPAALAQVRGDVESQNGKWGLPDVFFGMKTTIENAVVNTAEIGVADSVDYILPDGYIYFLSRPEGLMGDAGVPNFATCNFFLYEDMTVESKTDPDNRRTKGRVVDDFDFKIVAPATGFLITGALSS